MTTVSRQKAPKIQAHVPIASDFYNALSPLLTYTNGSFHSLLHRFNQISKSKAWFPSKLQPST